MRPSTHRNCLNNTPCWAVKFRSRVSENFVIHQYNKALADNIFFFNTSGWVPPVGFGTVWWQWMQLRFELCKYRGHIQWSNRSHRIMRCGGRTGIRYAISPAINTPNYVRFHFIHKLRNAKFPIFPDSSATARTHTQRHGTVNTTWHVTRTTQQLLDSGCARSSGTVNTTWLNSRSGQVPGLYISGSRTGAAVSITAEWLQLGSQPSCWQLAEEWRLRQEKTLQWNTGWGAVASLVLWFTVVSCKVCTL
jgi:hypothetical protein